MRVRNAHTARIDDLAPGAEGEVDASKKGVKHLLDAGLLVPCEGGSLEASVGSPGDASSSEQDMRDAVEELERRGEMVRELTARAAELTTERDQLAAKVVELEALPKNAKDLRDQLIAARAEIATLKAPAGGG